MGKGTIPINREDTSLEVLARICKATADKYDCSMSIDFSQGKKEIRFIGDESCKRHILDEVQSIFK